MRNSMKYIVLLLLPILIAAEAIAQDGSVDDASSSNLKSNIAGEAEAPGPKIKIPSLRGHKFMPSTIVGNPFIATEIRNSLGYGRTMNMKLPVLVIDGNEVLSLEGDLIFLALNFEYRHAVKDWLGFWFGLSVTGRLGSGLQSILSQGVTTAMNTDMGWLFKLYRNDGFILSGAVGIRHHSITAINLRDFIERVIEDEGVEPDNTLIRSVPITRAGFGLRSAYAFNELWGVTAEIDNGFSESLVRGESAIWYFILGATVDIDLAMCSDIPFGLGLAYKYTNAPDGVVNESKAVHAASFVMNYTGTTDFLIGLDLTSRWTPMAGFDRTLNYFTAMINMRYYF